MLFKTIPHCNILSSLSVLSLIKNCVPCAQSEVSKACLVLLRQSSSKAMRIFQADEPNSSSKKQKKKLTNVPNSSPSSFHLKLLIRRRLIDYILDQDTPDKRNNEKYQFNSMAVENHYKLNSDSYAMIRKHRCEIKEKQKKTLDISSEQEVNYPLKGEFLNCNLSKQIIKPELAESFTKTISSDRGFYVYSGRYVDDYVAGSALEIPGDEMTDCTTMQFGPSDAVEVIDFQLPGQSEDLKATNQEKKYNEKKREWLENYGAVVPSVPASEKQCLGCGAVFHCKDSSLPGFLPFELFCRLDENLENFCRRCYMLKKYNFLLNVNICEADYRSLMEHLRMKEEVLILLIVDLADLPSSIFKDLPNIIGYNKPVIIVGNKVDLLPPDPRSGYLKHFRQAVLNAAIDAGFDKKFNILHTALISAKTGFGVEDLVTNIFLKWTLHNSIRNDIYLVGCTNVGKSTLFNILLQSDLCKVRALDLVERATTSIWPGTTISLLKFPVMNPTPLRLELRRRRLLKFRSWLMKERRLSRDILKETGDSKYVTLHAYVDNTFKDMDEKTRPVAPSNLAYLSNEKMFINTEQKLRDIKKRSWTLDHEAFAKGKWCYDTPGTVNNEQVLNIFTLDELIAILPKKMMVPRTFVVKPNETLLIAGIARIDFLELTADERGPTFLSVFANDSLPVNVMKTCEVKAFFERYWGSPALVVPFGSTKRLSDFPEMKSQKISFDSNGLEIGCADVIFSSIGWVCVTAPKSKIRLEAYTPGGRGLSLRVPPILPLCASNRGPRIVGTAAYKVKRVKLPVNMTRKWKKRNLKEN